LFWTKNWTYSSSQCQKTHPFCQQRKSKPKILSIFQRVKADSANQSQNEMKWRTKNAKWDLPHDGCTCSMSTRCAPVSPTRFASPSCHSRGTCSVELMEHVGGARCCTSWRSSSLRRLRSGG
jgi:hypothetical protein